MSKGDSGISHLSTDKKMANCIRAITLEKLEPTYDAYEGLLSSIVSQQLSVKAAATIYDRFLHLFPDQYPSADVLLNKSIEELRTAGLSRQKAQYVTNVANHFKNNQLFDQDWRSLSDQEIIDMLTQIKGVGRWTVEMILMFTLNRSDVLPLGDLGIQQAMMEIYGVKGDKKELAVQMQAIAEAWSPYRTLASRYLWAYKDAVPLL